MKKYIKPAVDMHNMNFVQMLAASPGVEDGSILGDDFLGDDVTYTKGEIQLWDEE